VNLQPDRSPLAINVVIPTHLLSCGMSSMVDHLPTDAQIAPYVRALEAILYDDLMEKSGIAQCLEKHDEVADKAMADEMKALCDARDSVMKVVQNTREGFLQRNPNFLRENRKIIRNMSQAPRTSDGVIVQDNTLLVKGVCCYATPYAPILHSWWYIRAAPDILLDKLTEDNVDKVPVAEVARKWFAATKAIHNYVDK